MPMIDLSSLRRALLILLFFLGLGLPLSNIANASNLITVTHSNSSQTFYNSTSINVLVDAQFNATIQGLMQTIQ